MHDFLDNLPNHQYQKMLREIANDSIVPKKGDKKVIYYDYLVISMINRKDYTNIQRVNIICQLIIRYYFL